MFPEFSIFQIVVQAQIVPYIGKSCSTTGMSAAENQPPTYFNSAEPAADQAPEIGSSRLETAGRYKN